MARQSTRPPAAPARHPGLVWLESHWNALPNNQWVAADASGLVAHSASFDDVVADLRRRGLDTSNVAFTFVTFDTLQ